MSRFQASTNPVIDRDLDLVRSTLGLDESHKAELLREMTELSAWLVLRAAQGMTIEARLGKRTEVCDIPALTHLRDRKRSPADSIALTDSEAKRLAEILTEGFKPTPALRKAFANLASPDRRPPTIRWKEKAR